MQANWEMCWSKYGHNNKKCNNNDNGNYKKEKKKEEVHALEDYNKFEMHVCKILRELLPFTI